MSIFKKIWHDPVGSKVIASLIVILIVGIYSLVRELYFSEFIIYSIIFLVILAIFFLLWYLFKRKPNTKEAVSNSITSNAGEPKSITSNEVKLKYMAPSGNVIAPAKKIEKTTIIDILPEEICEEIEKVPPYQQNSVAKHYIGTKVNWDLAIDYISKFGKRKVYISSVPIQKYSPTIICIVLISNFPFLKFSRKGDKIRIEGEILKCSTINIELTNCKLYKA